MFDARAKSRYNEWHSQTPSIAAGRPEKTATNNGGIGAGKQYEIPPDVAREIAIMKKMITHKHLVNLIDVLDNPNRNELYVVVEFVDGGPVMRDVGRQQALDESLTRDYMVQ